MKLGIIGAMPEEAALLRQSMKDVTTSTKVGMEFCEGTLADKDVVLVVAGVGKVNAAVCAQVLIDQFAVTHLILTGVAGSLDARIDVGDVVVSTDCVQHDMDLTGIGFTKGFPLGEDPENGVVAYAADKTLRVAAVRAVQEVAPEVRVYEGRIATGDQFVCSDVTKDHIVADFSPLCCEMEGGAVAQVAWMNKVPYVVVRSASDKADGAAEVDYSVFMSEAADRSAAIVKRMAALL